MIQKNPIDELIYFLTQTKKPSFHFGEVSLGVQQLLDALKEKGFVVHFIQKISGTETKLFTEEECRLAGFEFEHRMVDLQR
jgi:hypothetical protein